MKEIYKNLNVSLTYYLFLLALTTGMRFAELVGLKREDINFFNDTISINKTWGYTNKMHEGFGAIKNEQSVRIIKVDKRTMTTFRKLFDKTPVRFIN